MNKLFSFSLGAAALMGTMLLTACNDVSTELKTPTYNTGVSSAETKQSALKDKFPSQYASYKLTEGSRPEDMTKYKGPVAFRKNDNVNPLPKGFKHAQPYLKNLWLGYPFMYEYNEARGHAHALKDFVDIDRINRYGEKGILPTTCWNCKTPKMVAWNKEYGDKLWTMNSNEFRTKVDVEEESISCATCHDPKTMELRLYSVPLSDWIKRRPASEGPNDWAKISRNEKRSLVCAQCHVEYYFQNKDHGPAAKPVFPWDNGFAPEQIYEYYKTVGAKGEDGKGTPFFDWKHAASGVPSLKMQHPEYETWKNGSHGKAGVSCADCHLPYMREGGKKVSSHFMTSPLRDPELRACRQCHADKTPAQLLERVHYTQDKTYAQLIKAQDLNVKAHEAVRLAKAFEGAKHAEYDALMKEAVEMTRKAQMCWDWVSAENSVGFHNPSLALETLARSAEYSQQAIDVACRATQFGISEALAGNIREIVPPILEMSRKLQQDPEFLQKNPWTKLLKPLPKADQLWDGTKRLDGKTVSEAK